MKRLNIPARRYYEYKARAFAAVVLRPDFAMVFLYYFLTNRQTNSCAAGIASGSAALSEFIENTINLIFRDAKSFIGNSHG